MRLRRVVVAALPLLAVLLLVAWRIVTQEAQKRELAAQRLARGAAPQQVTLVEATTQDVTAVFEATGTLEAPLDVKISPKVTGRITYLRVHEGDQIRRGQVLVRIDSAEVEANVRQAEGAVAESEFRLAQATTTQNANDVSVYSQVQQQMAAVTSAQANYDQVRKNLDAQLSAARSVVTDAQGRIDGADGAMSNAKAAIASAQAGLENSTIHYDRLHALYLQGFTTAQDIDDAKAAVKVAQASLDGAQSALRVASASRDSATAQKRAAEDQVSIVATSGEANIEGARQTLAQANAALRFAKANLAQKPAYVQNLAALRSTVASNRAALEAAKARRADTVLSSPLDGFVTSRVMDPGSTVTPGQPIIGVQFVRQLWVGIAVPPSVSAALHIGGDAMVRFDDLPGRSFTGGIIQINPSADPQGRQFTVRAVLSNTDGTLKPGMFAHVAVVTARAPQAVAVPREAIRQDAAGSYVMAVDSSNTAHRRSVTTGLASPDLTAITDGLKAGEKVITLSVSAVREGQAVIPAAPAQRATAPVAW